MLACGDHPFSDCKVVTLAKGLSDDQKQHITDQQYSGLHCPGHGRRGHRGDSHNEDAGEGQANHKHEEDA